MKNPTPEQLERVVKLMNIAHDAREGLRVAKSLAEHGASKAKIDAAWSDISKILGRSLDDSETSQEPTLLERVRRLRQVEPQKNRSKQ